MTFNDVFKSSFLESISSFSVTDVAIGLIAAFILGLLIFFVYKKTFAGVMYSSSFGMSLIAMSVVTSLVIMAVTSNIILSLGMVGALSIVRFRTAVKEPMDIAYMFWAIAVGIVTGAGLIIMAVIGSVFVGVIMVVLSRRKNTDTPYVLVVTCNDSESEDSILSFIDRSVKKSQLKSKTVRKDMVEITMEVKLRDNNTKFINELSNMENISNAVMVSFNGEYMS